MMITRYQRQNKASAIDTHAAIDAQLRANAQQ
jgi:hypothetical protein